MRTRFELIKYISTLRDNWEKMTQLSNNDYDIHYFDARISVDNEALDYLNDVDYWQNDDDYNIQSFIEFLINNFTNSIKDNISFYNKHNCYNEKYSGFSDEYILLFSIASQEYRPKFHVHQQLLKTAYKIYK
jgi:hypothetical protein